VRQVHCHGQTQPGYSAPRGLQIPVGWDHIPDGLVVESCTSHVELHLAVIADMKHTLKALYVDKVHVTHWSICGKDGTEFGIEKPTQSLLTW
jgi:hypothetical protein